MRIAQVVSLYESVPPESKNGLEFVVSWLTEELVARGHEVTLFAPANSITQAKLVSIIPKGFINANIKNFNFTFYSIWNTLLAGLQSKEFDIIHTHNANGHYITPLSSCPIIETVHSPSVNNTDDKIYTEHLQPVLEQLSKVHYVTVSKKQEVLYSQGCAAYFKKHSTVYNGIPLNKFVFSATPKDYLFYIGYINKNKGADVAVQVARKLGMKLILAGNNFGEETFFEKHIQPFLDGKISYVGPVDFETKNELYRNAVATLAPIHWEEPFGLTIVESQACGTPVIAFDKGASKEIIDHGKTGFVVKDEQEMIDAVGKIQNLDRKSCRDWVEERFSIKKMVDEYETLYRKLHA